MVDFFLADYWYVVVLVGFFIGLLLFVVTIDYTSYGSISKGDARALLLLYLGGIVLTLLGPITFWLAMLALVGGVLYGLGVLIYRAFEGEDE